jgi:hypothetical protein
MPPSEDSLPLLRLRVSGDADPTAIARVVERFANLNVVPRRLLAERGSNDTLSIVVDVMGLTETQLALVAAKIGEAPCILSAQWHRV